MGCNITDARPSMTRYGPGMEGTVASLWTYPVKSFQGVRVDAVDLGADVETQMLLSAKRTGVLLDARLEGDDAVLPDGRQAPLGSAELDQAMSAWLGRAVQLVHVETAPSLPQSMALDNENESSAVIRWRTPRGRYVDLFPIHFLTTATMAAVAARHGDLDWDVRRFRPNMLFDLACDERELFGATLQVGDAVVRVPEQLAERCVMVTRPQPAVAGSGALGLQRLILRALARDAGRPDATLTAGSAIAQLGAYAEVVTPGRVHVGAAVRRL
jgi:uncharacterized protein